MTTSCPTISKTFKPLMPQSMPALAFTGPFCLLQTEIETVTLIPRQSAFLMHGLILGINYKAKIWPSCLKQPRFRISYTPAAPILVQTLPTAWVASTVYAAGSFCTATYTVNGNSVTQVFLALNGGISGTTQPTFNIPGTTTDGTGSNQITWVYKGPSTLFATSFDGISGWEDYVIIDAALKCAAKQEQDCSVFMAQKQALMQRIEWASANRQGSDPIVAPYGWGHNGDSGNGWGNC